MYQQLSNTSNNIQIKFGNKVFELTEKEMECILNMSIYCTNKAIARVLHLSHRTVESYIDKVKTKLKCYHKSEIIPKLLLSEEFRQYLINQYSNTSISSQNVKDVLGK